MIRPRRILCSVLVTLCIAAPNLRAQEKVEYVKLDRLSAEVSGSYDGSWLQWPTYFTNFTTWRESLDVELDGWSIHPDVATFRLYARPSFVQNRQTVRVSAANAFNRDTDRLNGGARFELFRRSTIQGSLWGSRSRSSAKSTGGGSQEIHHSTWGAEVRGMNGLMPEKLSYLSRRESVDWATGLPGNVGLRDNWTGLLRYEAKNAKTQVLLERLDVRRDGAANDPGVRFKRRQAFFTHGLTWGKGSQLRSRIRYVDRATSSDVLADVPLRRSIAWTENANLVQSSTVQSSLSGGWNRQFSETGVGTLVHGRYAVTYNPTRRVGVTMLTSAASSSGRGVKRTRYQTGPRSSFWLSLPRGARLTANLEAVYRWNRQSADGTLFGEAVQEPYRMGAAGVVELQHPYVVLSSIVIFNGTGDRVYEAGFDYRLVPNGPYVEIHLLPNGQIPADGELLVDYRYEIEVRAASEDLELAYNTSLNVGPLSLRASRRWATLVSDMEKDRLALPRIRDRYDVSASLGQQMGRFSVALSAGRGGWRGNGGSMQSRSKSANLSVGVRLAQSLYVNSSGDYRSTTGTGSRYTSRRFTNTLAWSPHVAIRVSGTGSYWSFIQNERRENLAGGGGLVEFGRRSRTLRLQYDYHRWQNGNENSEHRLSLTFSQKLGRF